MQNLVCKHQEFSYTHIILDEVHERSVDIDIIMLVIRKLALKFPDLKVVLMSATLQEDLFVNYFQQVFGPEQVCEPYFVGMKRFPIDVYFIDEIDALRMEHYWCKEQLTSANHLKTLVHELSQDPEIVKPNPVTTAFTKKFCTNLIISQSKLGEGILVFLPSFSDLSDYYNELTSTLRRKRLNDRILVFVFHGSLVPNEDQDAIFKLPPHNKVHVILSNKVAESSITIPNLRMVINFGINQNLEYDSKKKISCLKRRWCSRSSCSQREGRVGRVFEGTVVHLFTRKFFDTSLPEFDAAEITKYPLAKTVLKARQLGQKLNIPLPSEFLSLVIEPPSLLNFEAALQDLVMFGAVEYSPDKGVREDTDATLVGKFCLSLPLDLKLGRLVLFGIFFGCPFDAIVMAAALSMYQDVFTLPTRLVIKDLVTYRHSLKRSMDARVNFDNGCYSDPIMMCNMFVEWLRFRNKSKSSIPRQVLAKQFAYKYSVRPDRLLHFESLVGEIAFHVCQFIPSTAPFYKQVQCLSQVVGSGGKMPCFEQPGIYTPAVYRSINIPFTAPFYKQVQCLSHVARYGGKMPCFEQPGIYTPAVYRSFNIPFCNDSVFLKALIAAASPNLIIHGKPQHESSDPYIRNRARVTLKAMAKDVQFDPYSTIAMEIEDAEADEDECDDNSIENDENEIVDEMDVCEIGKDEINEDEIDEDEINEDEIDEAILQKLVNEIFPSWTDLKVRIVDNIALVQFNQSSLMRFFWQFPEARDDWQIEGINATFPMPFHPCCLTWNRLTVDREHANVHYFNWRNPAGFVCRIQHPNQPVFGVASEVIGTNDPYNVLVSKLTILPEMPQGLLLLLAFQPISTNIELLLEKENSRISAVRINSQEIKNTAEFIDTADIRRINKLRKTLSKAMICFLNGSTIPIDHPVIMSIPTLLQDVLNRTDSDLSNPPMHATTEGNVLQSHHPATVWETVLPGVDFSAVSQTLVDNKCSDYYPSFQCSLTGGQPHSVKEVVLSQAQGETTLHTPLLNVQCHSLRDQQASGSIYVKVREPCDTGSMIRPQRIFKPILQSSLQPGSDQHIAKFFIKYLKENGGRVSITVLSQVLHQTYFKKFRKQVKSPNIKLKRFFKKHPNFEIIKESNTGTRAVKLQKATTKSLRHPSPQPGSEQHMVEFCVQSLKKSRGEAPLITLWRKYHREYRYNHHRHEVVLRRLVRTYPQYFTLMKESTFQMEMVKLSRFSNASESFSHFSVQSCKPKSHQISTCSLELVPTPNSDQSHKPSPLPYHSPKSTSDLPPRLNWLSKPSSEEYLLDIFYDFVEDNEGETSQCILQRYFTKHQKETSQPKIKFKKFFKTHFQVSNTSCVGASMKIRKPTMRLEQDVTPKCSTRKHSIALCESHLKYSTGLSVGLYFVTLQKPIEDVTAPTATVESLDISKMLNPSASTLQSGSSHRMVDFFINYLEHNGEKSIQFLFQNNVERYCFQQLKQTRESKRIFRKFFKSYPQHFKVFRNSDTGLCMVKLWKPIVGIQLRSEEVSPLLTQVSTVKSSDNKPTVKLSELHCISVTSSPSVDAHQSCQPGSDQHILHFFIDYLEHNGREVSTSVLSKVFGQSYLSKYKDHWKQTRTPEVKLKVFFETHPQHFQVVKNSTTGTRVVKLVRNDSLTCQRSTTMLDPTVQESRLSRIEPTESAEMLSDASNLLPGGAVSNTANSIHSLSSEPGSDEHMVQYFVDCLKKRGGEASISSLRKAFATYMEMLPVGVLCRYNVYLGKSFFESHPKYFKLVQECGICTVKLSLTSTDNENLASGNATSIPAILDPEPVAKQSHVTKICTPAVGVQATSVLSSAGVSDHQVDVKLRSTSSSTVHHPGSEGNSRNSIPSTIQPRSYGSAANQDSKLQPSSPLLTRALTYSPYECSKPGSDQHMVQYFVDFLKKTGGEASITSLRKAFATYVEMLPVGVLCHCSFLRKKFFESRPKYFKLVQRCGFSTVKLSLTSTDNESLASGNAVDRIQAVLDPEPVVKHSHVTERPAVVETTSVLMPTSSTSVSDHRIDAKLQPTSSSTVCQSGSEEDSGESVFSTIQPRSYVPAHEASQDSDLQPSTALLTKALTSECSKPGSDQHMVQYFVDFLKKTGGEASITSLRKAFATYVEMLPVGVLCHCSFLCKKFFESRPKYFKLVQRCGFSTVKLSLTSTDNESLASGNAVNCIQAVSDPEPVVKHSHVTERPAVVEATSVLMPSSSTSVSDHRINDNLQPASSSTVCHLESEGDSTNCLSSTIQPCKFVPEASQDSELQPSGSLLTKTLKTFPYKPGSDQHMVQYFVDFLKKRGGEASITSLRKAFVTYLEMLPVGISCPYVYLGKAFFKSRPKYFKLVQGCGFCTVKLSLTSTDNESLASGNAVNCTPDSEQVARHSHVTKKCTPVDVEATSVLSSTRVSDHRVDVKLQPASSSTVHFLGSEGGSRNPISSTIQPCSYVPDASQDSELQPSDPFLTKALTVSSIVHECSKPGSDQHMVQYFVDCLKKRGGEATITSLRKAFATYVETVKDGILYPYSYVHKSFFKDHPEYFRLVQGYGFCTVKLSLTSTDEVRNEGKDITKTVPSQCAATATDPELKVKQKSKGYPASAITIKKSCSHSAKAKGSVLGRVPIAEVPPGEKTALDAAKPANVESRHVKVLPASNAVQCQYRVPAVRPVPSSARQDKKRSV